MKGVFTSAFVLLVFSLVSVFGRRLTAKKPFLDLTLPQVSPPRVNFECGRRGSIPIIFGSFNSPFSAASSRKKRATGNRPLDVAQPQIVGGSVSFKNSWPWMVLFGRGVGPSSTFFCSGVLINAQHVLTAAHCVLDRNPFFIRLGEHDHSVSGGQSRAPEDVEVDDIIVHPKYDVTQGYHDVAVIKLVRPVTIRNEIRPICLPWGNTMNEDLVNQKVTVTGWGDVEFRGSASMVLQEVKIDVFEPSVCHKSYSTLGDFVKRFPKGLNRQNIVCAGSPLGGKDACQGDSGGPMVHESRDSSYTLAGIVSGGHGCGKADFPGLYTPIRNFDILTWIKKTAF